MTIKFYSKKNCDGKVTIIDEDIDSFSSLSTLGSTASIELTSENDRILLFKKKKWNGDVLFLSGKQTITDLGDEDQVGKKGFRNSVNSVRITPFSVRLKYHIIKDNNGTLPRDNSSPETLEILLAKMRTLASNIWEDEAMIKLTDGGLTYQVNDALFKSECGNGEIHAAYPDLVENRAHVFIVNEIDSLGCAGRRKVTPGFFVASGPSHSLSAMTRTLAHELGHSWGLDHGREVNPDGTKLMTQTGEANEGYSTRIGKVQVEKVHEGLSDKSGDKSDYRLE